MQLIKGKPILYYCHRCGVPSIAIERYFNQSARIRCRHCEGTAVPQYQLASRSMTIYEAMDAWLNWLKYDYLHVYDYNGSPMLDYKHNGPIDEWKGWQLIADELQDFVDNMQIDWDEDCVRGDEWEIYSDNIFNLHIAGLAYLKYADIEALFEMILMEGLELEEHQCYELIVKHWGVRYLHLNANGRNELKLFKLVVIFDVKTKRRPLTKREAQLERQLDY